MFQNPVLGRGGRLGLCQDLYTFKALKFSHFSSLGDLRIYSSNSAVDICCRNERTSREERSSTSNRMILKGFSFLKF